MCIPESKIIYWSSKDLRKNKPGAANRFLFGNIRSSPPPPLTKPNNETSDIRGKDDCAGQRCFSVQNILLWSMRRGAADGGGVPSDALRSCSDTELTIIRRVPTRVMIWWCAVFARVRECVQLISSVCFIYSLVWTKLKIIYITL